MLLIFFALVVVYAVLKYKVNCEHEYEEERKKHEDKKRKIKQAIENGKSYYTERWDSRGELRVNIETGKKYREEVVGDHLCHFDEFGHLIHDITKERLDKELGGERERAIKAGRRLYMSDNRVTNGVGADDLSGARYTDLITGKEYVLGEFGCPGVMMLVDVETMIIYDVVKQFDERRYLETPEKFYEFVDSYCINNVKEFVERLNWKISHTSNRKEKRNIIYRYITNGYVKGVIDGYPENEIAKSSERHWSKMLDIDIRDEFKQIINYPIVISEA